MIPIVATGADSDFISNLYIILIANFRTINCTDLISLNCVLEISFFPVFVVAFCALGLVVHYVDFEHTDQC